MLGFYRWIAESVIQENCENSKESNEFFVPISNWEMQHEPSKIYKEVTNIITQHKGPADVLLINMSGPHVGIFRGQLLNHLATAMVWISNEVENIVSILLVDQNPSTGDVFLRTIQQLTEDKRLLLIDISGQQYPLSYQLPADFHFDFLTKSNEVRTKPIDLLKFKMVQRLGHFKWYVGGKHAACNRYFYDGSKCKTELVAILKSKILSIKSLKQASIDTIVYHASFSPWLEESLITIHEDMGIPIYTAADFVKRRRRTNISSCIVIVADLVNTGKTIAEVHSSVVKKEPAAQVSVVSVLTTVIDDEENFTRSVGEDDHRFTVDCIHRVKLNSFKPDLCPMCDLDLPGSSTEDEDYDMFTTYDMWTLNDEAGFIRERDVPPTRKGFDFVPDYASMITTHGAWIAYKLQRLLDSNGISSIDLVVISPAQNFPKVFSSFLRHVLNVNTFIQIPDELIENLLRNSTESEKVTNETLTNSKEEWVKAIRTVTNENVVILDEFQASGKTFDAIQRIVNAFDKKVKCYLPLIDFNPRKSEQNPVPTLSLYQIQRNWS